MLSWGIIHMCNIQFTTLTIFKCVLVLLSSFTLGAVFTAVHLQNSLPLAKLKLCPLDNKLTIFRSTKSLVNALLLLPP